MSKKEQKWQQRRLEKDERKQRQIWKLEKQIWEELKSWEEDDVYFYQEPIAQTQIQ